MQRWRIQNKVAFLLLLSVLTHGGGRCQLPPTHSVSPRFLMPLSEKSGPETEQCNWSNLSITAVRNMSCKHMANWSFVVSGHVEIGNNLFWIMCPRERIFHEIYICYVAKINNKTEYNEVIWQVLVGRYGYFFKSVFLFGPFKDLVKEYNLPL